MISCVHMRRSAVAVVVVVGLVVAGCGGGSDDEPASTNKPTTTRPTTSPTTQDQQAADEKELRKLAEDWYEVRVGLLAAPELDLQVLSTYLIGKYESTFRRTLTKRHADGFVSKEDPAERARHATESVRIEGDVASIVECIVDANQTVRVDTGAVVNDSVETVRLDVTAERTPRGWRLSDAVQVERWEGVTGCAA